MPFPFKKFSDVLERTALPACSDHQMAVVPRIPSRDFPIAEDSPSLRGDLLSGLCHPRGQKQNKVFPYSSIMLQLSALCSLAERPLQDVHAHAVIARRTGRVLVLCLSIH